MPSTPSKRILSIQSHVAFGYVGGKAAVFPLQCLGYDVDVVHTVSFSNHSGYGRFGGWRATKDDLDTVFGYMKQNGLLKSDRLLTGYMPGAEALQSVKDLALELRSSKPGLIYLLDPVMGDAGRLYVSPEVIPIYKSLLPTATITTPNWFEVETLTGVPLRDVASLRHALFILHHELHVPNVVISSMPASTPSWSGFPAPAQSANIETTELLACICSADGGHGSAPIIHAHTVGLIPGYFSGVGDLFSALVLAHFSVPSAGPASGFRQLDGHGQTPLSRATSAALAKTHNVLARTQAYFEGLPEDERTASDEEKDRANPERRVARMRARELKLVQSQDIIRDEELGKEGMVLWKDFGGLA